MSTGELRQVGHFVGAKEIPGRSGRFGDVFEPMTGDVRAKVALASRAEMRAAIENAKEAQRGWAPPARSAAPAS